MQLSYSVTPLPEFLDPPMHEASEAVASSLNSTDTILASISRSHLLFHMTAADVLPKLWLLLAGELLPNFDLCN